MSTTVNISTDPTDDVQRVNAIVSQNFKLFREQSGLSFDQLAKKSGVSKGMLVEIEKGSANPSIATLCKAAIGLGVSVADFVGVASNVPVKVVSADDASTLWHGPQGGTATLLVGTKGPEEIELWRWQMFPGETYESPGHTPGTLELINIEQGELTFLLGDNEQVVPAGSSLMAKTEQPHVYANEGSEVLQFVMTVAELPRSRRRTDLVRES